MAGDRRVSYPCGEAVLICGVIRDELGGRVEEIGSGHSRRFAGVAGGELFLAWSADRSTHF